MRWCEGHASPFAHIPHSIAVYSCYCVFMRARGPGVRPVAQGFSHLSDRLFEAAAYLFGVAVEHNDLIWSYHYHQCV